MNPGFPRPGQAGENAAGAFSGSLPPAIPDHTLIRLIGRGSYGEVWLARNVMGTLRAVKLVHRAAFADERPYEREFSGIQRFEPVSRTHDGLVDILQVGRHDAAGYFYYVMELADNVVDGTALPSTSPASPVSEHYTPRTLACDIARRGALPADASTGLALSLAGALAHLHKHGLVHRDIKPANIIFVGGQAKLADIGLVSEAGGSGSYVGTEGYIPPEGPGTRQGDLYSLGKLIYEAATGRDRMDFPSLPIELARLESGKQFLELNAIFAKACAHDPQQRYQSAEELRADLALLQSGKSVRRLRTIERRLSLATRIGAAAFLLAALAFAAFGFARRQARLDRHNYLRIERAEKEARAQLRQALLSQAQALRRSGQSGQRFDSLAALAKAIAIEAPTNTAQFLELRAEAVGALMLADIRLTRPGFLKANATNAAVDGALERYASAGEDGSVLVRAVADDQLLAKLTGPREPVRFIHHFSPDGRFLPVLYGDGLIRVWDLARREVMLGIRPEHEEVQSLEFSPDGRALVVVNSTRSIQLYELPSGTLLKSESPGVQWLRTRFRPDGKVLAIASEALTAARLVDIETGTMLGELPHPRVVHALSWSPNGEFLATGCSDGKVYLWHFVRHPNSDPPVKLEPAFVLAGHQSAVTEVDFHPNGQLIASLGWDGMIRLWDAASGEALVMLPARGTAMRFSRDGRHLIFYQGAERALAIAEVAGQRVYRLLRKPSLVQSARAEPMEGQHCAAFSPDERWLASGQTDGLRVWDAQQGSQAAHVRGSWVRSVFFHPDGTSLFMCGDDGVMSWPMEPLLQTRGTNAPAQSPMVPGHPFLRGCLSTPGDELAYISGNGVGLLHSRREFEGPQGLNFVAMSSNGRWLAASTWGNNGGRLWELPSGKHARDFAKGATVNVGFSPDSRWLITGEGDAYRFWDAESGQPGRRISRKDSADGLGVFAFSLDGKNFACALSRTRVQLFNAKTFEEWGVLELPGLPMINALAFSPSGTQLAVATATPFLQLWDLRLMREQLAALKLDWAAPPLPAAPTSTKSPRPETKLPSIVLSSDAPSTDSITNGGLVNLTPFFNTPLDKLFTADNNLTALPKGLQRFGGVDYDVRGAIMLRSQHYPTLPRDVRHIPLDRNCQTLHFLHGTAWQEKEGTSIGAYVIRFADGTREEVPIIYGRDVRNWWLTKEQYASGEPSAVWVGTTPAATRSGFEVHLFHSAWKNQRPEVEIRDLDFVTTDTECPPFLIAITAE